MLRMTNGGRGVRACTSFAGFGGVWWAFEPTLQIDQMSGLVLGATANGPPWKVLSLERSAGLMRGYLLVGDWINQHQTTPQKLNPGTQTGGLGCHDRPRKFTACYAVR